MSRPAHTPAARSALVLAGGLGTRLRRSIADRPKVLAEVAGRPFLSWLLDDLAAAGIERAVLCTGYLGEMIPRTLGSVHEGMALDYRVEDRPLGTAGALREAARSIASARGATEQLLVLNGDSWCDGPVSSFAAFAAEDPSRPSLAAVRVEDASRFGTIETDDGRTVRAFAEKAGTGPGLVNAGIYAFPAAFLAALPDESPLSLERQVLPGWIGGGIRLFPARGPLLDIGTPRSYVEAQSFFARRGDRIRPGRRVGLLLLDRDGTLIEERPYLADPNEVRLLPGVVEGLKALSARGYDFAILTNQSGIGRGYFDEDAMHAVHARLVHELGREGILLRGIWYCPHRPEEGCSCRKPEAGLLDAAIAESGYEPERCIVVGDKECDVELGRRAGTRTVLVRTGHGARTERERKSVPDLTVAGLDELARRVEIP
ncbi:MAG: HAD-IIIA family hydrolase [Planctomycetota bacterium]